MTTDLRDILSARAWFARKHRAIAGSVMALCAAGIATQSPALALTDCERVTHVSHGGEADHQDLGEGRVMWREWWSQEGTYTAFAIVECADGSALMFRTAENNMTTRLPFDRTERSLTVVDHQHTAARAFATLPRIADALDGTARDIELKTLQAEPCACAALYGDLRGTKTEFTLGG